MPDVWINLAHVYFAQGNFALAVKMVSSSHFIEICMWYVLQIFSKHLFLPHTCVDDILFVAVSKLSAKVLL